jgi:hypothetical protein
VLKVPLSATAAAGPYSSPTPTVRAFAPSPLAHRSESEAEVLSGLRGGESVILYPSDEIADGVRVR